MGKRGKKRKQLRRAEQRRKALERMTATLPDGTEVQTTTDSRRRWPSGTMLVWNELSSRGRPEMRWTVVGGGWPFDD